MSKDKLYQLISDLVYGEDEPSTNSIHKVVDEILDGFNVVKSCRHPAIDNSTGKCVFCGFNVDEANRFIRIKTKEF